MDNLIGRTLKSYELRERVGAGGFGAVYRAYQTGIGREVAIKVILPQYANDPDFVRRFEVEAQLIARLEHPHIVPLYDYWRDPEGAFLVMRWLRGNLRLAAQRGPWSAEAVARLLEQITSALTIAHRENVVHRDIKPENILLDEDDNAYLADFGIAKDLNLRNITATGAIIGSPSYITPEQIKGEPVTTRTDIYSLGLVVYELLVGEKPYPQATTPAELIHKHLTEPLPPLAGNHLPAALNEVLQTATAKDPTHRYGNAARLALAFRAVLPAFERRGLQPLSDPLTGRELDILRLMIDGLNNEEIAQKLYLSRGTVKWYVKQIYGKLDAHSRHQAIERAQGLNLFSGANQVISLPGAGLMENVSTALGLKEAIAEPTNPYKGLRAFQEADAADFFGRAALTEHLLGRLTDKGDGERFLAVVGPSGSGKSSVVRAGLITALRRGGLPYSEQWFISEMLPGTHPLEELEAALLRVAVNPIPGLLDQLAEDRRGLVRAAKRILPPNQHTELLLVIDQFEELFTLVEDENMRAHFIDNLLAAVTDPRSCVRVVLTLRADFYDRPLLYPRLAELVRSHTAVVVPLAPAELERAIAGPAERVGLVLEHGLVATMVNEIGQQPGALPLLQYALTELYERREGLTLTLDAYRAAAGISGALARRADELYLSLDVTGQEATRQLFLRLITLGEGAEDTRRRTLLNEIMAIADNERTMEEVIDNFTQYRLLTLDHDLLTRGPTLEVAHEALIREWGRLREWLNESRNEIRLQRQLSILSSDWEQSQQEVSFLLHGTRLGMFEKWAQETTIALSEGDRGYLAASVIERERQAHIEGEQQARELRLAQSAASNQRRAANRLRWLLGVMLVGVIAALGLSGVAVNNANEAQRSADQFHSLALGADSQLALNEGSNGDLALILGLEAVKIDNPPPRAQLALAEAAYAPGTRWLFNGADGTIDAIAISPDGRYSAIGLGRPLFDSALEDVPTAEDNTIRLLDMANGQQIQVLRGHRDTVIALSFSPDGRYLLSGSFDTLSGSPETAIILWDVATGEVIRRYRWEEGIIHNVVFTPDGRHFISYAGQDLWTLIQDSITLWDIESGEKVLTLAQDVGQIKVIDISPDGRYVVILLGEPVGDPPQTRVLVLDSLTGQQVREFIADGPPNTIVITGLSISAVNYAVFLINPVGVFTWDVETGELIGAFDTRFTLTGFGNVSWWSMGPDGRSFVTSTENGEIQIRNLATWAEVNRFRAHTGFVTRVMFTPDGQGLLSAADDGVRLWNLESGAFVRNYEPPPLQEEAWFIPNVRNVAFLPDGHSFLSFTRNGTLLHRDLETGRVIQNIQQPVVQEAQTWGMDVTPDGRAALVGAYGGKAALYDLANGQIIRTFAHWHTPPDHDNPMVAVDISPDGLTALTGTQADVDGMVLWDLNTGAELHRFPTSPLINGALTNNLLSLSYSPDGRSALAGVGDGTIILYDLQTYEEIRRYGEEQQQTALFDVEFSPDGKLIVSAGADSSLILWDAETGALLHRLVGHNGEVRGANFSPDGKLIVSVSLDRTIIIWDTASGEPIRQFRWEDSNGMFSVAFSPDGKHVLAGGVGETALWRVDTTLDDLITWTLANRYVPQPTCVQRELYRMQPNCVNGVDPTFTP